MIQTQQTTPAVPAAALLQQAIPPQRTALYSR